MIAKPIGAIPLQPSCSTGGGGGGGGGGRWSVRRDRPPRAWVAEGAARWWTVVLVNWEDEAQEIALPLTALGIGGARCNAYDVWRDTPLADPKDTIATTLEPRSALTVALRPASAHPQSEEHTSELQSPYDLVCRLLLEKKKKKKNKIIDQKKKKKT